VSPFTLNKQVTERVDSDADATFRQDVLNAVPHSGGGEVLALIEASSGRKFAACMASALVPAPGKLLTIGRCVHTSDDARSACDV
jgi:hypothetical protein